MSNKALDGILDWMGGQDKKAQQVDYSPGAGVAQWQPQILQALSLLGQSSGWLGTVERRMNQESGGNPTAVNRWDINWQNGTPSVGLMQVIGPTFSTYAGQFRGVGPFMYGTSIAPLPNIYSGLNYALHAYGSLSALNRPGGYDSGGLLMPGATMAINATGRPERVLNAEQTARLDALLNSPGTAGGVTIEAINVHGSFDFSSPAARHAAARALVAEMKEALRRYDRERAR
jgi:SLT domain-containing protein